MRPRTLVTAPTYAEWKETAVARRDVVFRGVDLRADDDLLADMPPPRDPAEACVFLGCLLGPRMAIEAARTGALVMPRIPGVGIDPYRSRLYDVDELYAGFRPGEPGGAADVYDARIYRSYMRVNADGMPVSPPQRVPVGVEVTLARRLHDGSISDALDDFLAPYNGPEGQGVVAFMGGHDVPRGDPAYRQVAGIARTLAAHGLLVATGGGPGLMEAANLGAWASARPDGVLEEAIAVLSTAPVYGSAGWADTAWDVRARFPAVDGGGVSLGVPTWFYGHEPPNMFASHIAKYFENSLREEGLLAIATHGVVFAPGRAGTVQEIFQDACQNFYAVYGVQSPMILLGRRYWGGRDAERGVGYPVAPLLQGLARDGDFADRVHITDDGDEVVRIVEAFDPG